MDEKKTLAELEQERDELDAKLLASRRHEIELRLALCDAQKDLRLKTEGYIVLLQAEIRTAEKSISAIDEALEQEDLKIKELLAEIDTGHHPS